jgi:hypothetical protein
LPRKVFVANEILTASDVNTFLGDQAVMVFADDAARGSAIPSPSEGMVTYREDDDLVEVYNGSSFVPVGGILQVVSTTKSDIFSTTSTSFVDITGFSASITPSSATSKILITASMYGDNSGADLAMIQLLRDSTAIAIGDAALSRVRATTALGTFEANRPSSASVEFLDSPATTSAIVYKFQMRVNAGTGSLNRTNADNNDTGHMRAVSTITVMEVAG